MAARFALTGGAATLVHLAVALTLIRLGLAALIANALAFAMAFLVSFWGHHLFTFAGHGTTMPRSLSRFVVVAALGFLTNETVLAILLAAGLLPATPALLISTLTAAICTFFLSRHWAFGPAGRGAGQIGGWGLARRIYRSARARVINSRR